jgi:hypothetical protein
MRIAAAAAMAKARGSPITVIEFFIMGAFAKAEATYATYPLQVAQTKLRSQKNGVDTRQQDISPQVRTLATSVLELPPVSTSTTTTTPTPLPERVLCSDEELRANDINAGIAESHAQRLVYK